MQTQSHYSCIFFPLVRLSVRFYPLTEQQRPLLRDLIRTPCRNWTLNLYGDTAPVFCGLLPLQSVVKTVTSGSAKAGKQKLTGAQDSFLLLLFFCFTEQLCNFKCHSWWHIKLLWHFSSHVHILMIFYVLKLESISKIHVLISWIQYEISINWIMKFCTDILRPLISLSAINRRRLSPIQ